MRRLLPDPGSTTVAAQLESFRPWEEASEARPFVAMNFAATVDGRASIGGVSGPIGSGADTEMLARLRTRFDAIMIGAGTMRAERYGRAVRDPAKRTERERLGLRADPLVVIVSGRLDLPWDAPLFSAGEGRVLLFTASETEPPETATPVEVVRHAGFVELGAALRHLREEQGIRALICEGGPGLHAELEGGGMVDELFLTIAPKLVGGEAPRILEGPLPEIAELELAWLLEEEGELFARYRRRRAR
ncbi:MAG TPA: dihydrofolate reductase family protein [Solirubrobacterales bacterium]|nr:dihydrofolate reductase family protein [Solirubrobacterales bacterium]